MANPNWPWNMFLINLLDLFHSASEYFLASVSLSLASVLALAPTELVVASAFASLWATKALATVRRLLSGLSTLRTATKQLCFQGGDR